MEQLESIRLASLSKMTFFPIDLSEFHFKKKKKKTLKSSLTPRFNISQRLHISIKNPTLMISFEDALGTEFLPALEQMMS